MATASIHIRPTFVPYKPISRYNVQHPGDVVETLSLSSVPLRRPNYEHSIPEVLLRSSEPSLSSVQMDAVLLAGAAHSKFLPSLVPTRQGFLIGDGTGVGKGREIMAIILDNWNKGRTKSLVLSSSPILIQDLRRDLKDLLKPMKGPYHDNRPPIHIMEMPEQRTELTAENGVLFSTYATLSSVGSKTISDEQGLQTLTSRFNQIIGWLGGRSFDGVIVFDEAHRAKGFSDDGSDSSKIGDSVVSLQETLGKARIVYVSATIASSVRHMEFMTRLGLWGAKQTGFQSASAFFTFVENRGITGSEIVACEMKNRGIYASRHLDYSSCSFRMETATLSPKMQAVYDKCSQIWIKIILLCDKKERSHMWATCQKFFKNLCIASKLPTLFEIIQKALKNNQSVVIGLHSTGGAPYDEFSKSEHHSGSDLFSPCRTYLESFLLNHFHFSPVELGLCVKREEKSSKSAVVIGGRRKCQPPPSKKSRMDSSDEDSEEDDDSNMTPNIADFREYEERVNYSTVEEVASERKQICKLFKDLAPLLPLNTIDCICAEFGYMNVSEMTGRGAFQMLVKNDNGTYSAGPQTVRLKTALDIGRQSFQEGHTRIVIISEAASTGISLHSSRSCQNQQQRLHIMLESPWSAMSACQQIGRTNRSNQVVPPSYIILMSAIEAERRFATTLAGRMGNLGALCKGDRKSSHGTLWKQYEVDVNQAKKAIKGLLNTISGRSTDFNFFNSQEDEIKRHKYRQVLFNVQTLHTLKTAKLGSQLSPSPAVLRIDKFLNRVLCMEVKMQAEILDLLDTALLHIKNKSDDTEAGQIQELNDEIGALYYLENTVQYVLGPSVSSVLQIYQKNDLFTWKDVKQKIELLGKGTYDFYARKQASNNYKVCVGIKRRHGDVLDVFRPSTKEPGEKPLRHLKRRGYKVVDESQALNYWNSVEDIFRSGKCSGYLKDHCEGHCDHKQPFCKFGVLSGALLSVWNNIESVTHHKTKFVRHYDNEKQFVGLLIGHEDLDASKHVLQEIQKESRIV